MMDWTGKTVLVTGAGGFIGSHLTERLVELGADTRALVEYNSSGSWGWLDESAVAKDIQVFLGNVQDRDSLQKPCQGVNIVFHLAALVAIPYSYTAPLSYIRTNVEGTLNVLQSSLDAGAGLVVHTSTSEVYGTALRVPINEDHPLQGQSPYSASKIGADKIAEAFHLSFGLPVATIRPFNTFGPRQSSRAVIPTIITQALTQDEIRLGALDPTRDFSYVLDIAEGFIRAADSPGAIGRVTNLGTGQEISIGELAETILKMTGASIPIVTDQQRFRPENSEVERLCADNSAAKSVLGWTPKHSLTEGLEATIEWFKRHLSDYKSGAYTI